ncbi:MAG: TIM barrel protein [Bacteroidota bacterium]
MTRQRFLQQMASAGLIVGAGLPALGATVPRTNFSIHIFSKHLQFLDYSDMAQAAKELGFDGVDLTVRRGGHVDPKQVADQLPRAAEAIDQAGLKLEMMTTGITDPDQEDTELILKTAAQAGVQFYRMGGMKYQKDQALPEQIEEMRAKFQRLADLNRHYQIKGAYQNHSGVRVGAPVWDLHLLLADLDPAYLGIQFDIRHATVEGGQAWPLGLQLIHPLIHTMDIKDFVWEKRENGWNVKNVPLGEGMVDWEKYIAQLNQYEIRTPLSIHYEYELGGAEHGKREIHISEKALFEAMRKDLKWLKARIS